MLQMTVTNISNNVIKQYCGKKKRLKLQLMSKRESLTDLTQQRFVGLEDVFNMSSA